MKKELTSEEMMQIAKIVDRYRDVEHELNSIDEEIANLFTRKDVAVNQLDDLKKQESSFMSSLRDKYGEGHFDPLTMSYVLKEKYEEI